MVNKIEKNLKFWGHNCFSVTSGKTLLITDPWFSKSGAFLVAGFSTQKIIILRKKF